MKIGDKIKDNDPRMPNRVLTIKQIEANHVWAGRQENIFPVRIRKDRIYTDGKPRRSGFTLIKEG